MRYNKFNNRGFRNKKDKFTKDEGMTVTVRQVKNKDGTITDNQKDFSGKSDGKEKGVDKTDDKADKSNSDSKGSK